MNNVRKNSPILKEMEDKGEIDIIGGNYDISTGKVTFIEWALSCLKETGISMCECQQTSGIAIQYFLNDLKILIYNVVFGNRT